jgi:hypothetical protein
VPFKAGLIGCSKENRLASLIANWEYFSLYFIRIVK